MNGQAQRPKVSVVVTSIAAPTPAMRALADGTKSRGVGFVCVGDAKSPANWSLDGCRFLSLQAQQDGSTGLGKALPTGHYARKNLGYLDAMAEGADCIVETDDDNSPLDSFWKVGSPEVKGRLVEHRGWVNAYACFTSQPIWPRGFPLEQLTPRIGTDRPAPAVEVVAHCPVQQGLANGDSDVDAVYRMTRNQLVEFEDRDPLVLGIGGWCPFNSQNTRWWRPAFPLMYLPSHCSFRMTDIWRSFVVQACLWANGRRVAFLPASMRQDRNPHDLLRDFEAEMPGYLNNQRIVDALAALDLRPGEDAVRDNMRRCYGRLVKLGLVEPGELSLLDLWFTDLDRFLPAPRT